MNKIQTFDLYMGAINRNASATSAAIDLNTCRNSGRFSVQSILTARAVSIIGVADDWTEDGVTDGLWSRTWDEATYGVITSVYFNGSQIGTEDATPDTEFEWYHDTGTNTLSVFTATGDNNPAAYYSAITSYGSPTIQIDYLASNDGINYVAGVAIVTGQAVGISLPLAITPPLCRYFKMKVTEENIAAIGISRLLVAIQ